MQEAFYKDREGNLNRMTDRPENMEEELKRQQQEVQDQADRLNKAAKAQGEHKPYKPTKPGRGKLVKFPQSFPEETQTQPDHDKLDQAA